MSGSPHEQRTAFEADPNNTRAFEALEEHYFLQGEWASLVGLYGERLEADSLRDDPLKSAALKFRLAQIVEERLATVHGIDASCRTDLIGLNALHGSTATEPEDLRDIRLRIALRSGDRQDAEAVLWEVEALLCCGPAGGGGYRGRVDHSVLTYSTFLPRNAVQPSLDILNV